MQFRGGSDKSKKLKLRSNAMHQYRPTFINRQVTGVYLVIEDKLSSNLSDHMRLSLKPSSWKTEAAVRTGESESVRETLSARHDK